ncbi:hypothetical protein HMPREF1327_01320 [Enterococcus faecalis 599]|uniref:Uncharacterized protein n=1 Tax=Enterococcus faecalis TaxID=1351 RepID=A0A5P9W8W1_ENTFL|nr:hypothetical protein HMPREF1327_01320 [Enterococcus faecalis 599]QFX76012.1 hypothetical protein [Enterococcus faecalis]
MGNTMMSTGWCEVSDDMFHSDNLQYSLVQAAALYNQYKLVPKERVNREIIALFTEVKGN